MLFNKKFRAVFKKETVPIVCSSSSTCLGSGKPRSIPGLVFPLTPGRSVASRLLPSLAQLSFCSLQMPNPSSTLRRAPVLLLLSSPEREDFSIWQLGIRPLAWFPPFAPLDRTKQGSCLPGPYAVPERIHHWDPKWHRHQLTYQETCMFRRISSLWPGWQEVSCISSVYIKAEAGAQVTWRGWAPSVNKMFLLP